MEAAFRDLFQIFDALTIHVDDVLVDHESGDRVVYMSTITVTHLGEVLGFPGTGRRFAVKGVFMLGLKNGRIASERRLYDLTELILQIGS